MYTDEQFYEECARLLNTTHEGKKFEHYRRTRWNNRTPGRGRFADFGIIRLFGDNVQIALREPYACHQVIVGRDEAIEFLKGLINGSER